MAGEKAKDEISDLTIQDQDKATQRLQPADSKEQRKSNFGKALAHRALYGSSSRRGRKDTTNNARTLPSRLSKVSLADDTES